jgi:hypothetical protein
LKTIKVKNKNEIPNNYTGIIEHVDGSKAWYLNGKRHRVDGPAVEYVGGAREWYLNGIRYREDGPAYEASDGYREWLLNGNRLFELLPESQPFILLEEFIDEEGKEKIKILNQKGVGIWPNLPGLRELADNWSKK